MRLLFVLLPWLAWACSNSDEKLQQFVAGKEMQQETGRDVTLIYSDSAVIKVRITAPLMVRIPGENPVTDMPEGIRALFFDGNGRMARLIANLPVLAAGFPPILVPMSRRIDYIDLLWHYQNAVGRIDRGSRLWPPHPARREFESLLLEEWQKSTSLVEEANRTNQSFD
jgi:hypothetical protein